MNEFYFILNSNTFVSTRETPLAYEKCDFRRLPYRIEYKYKVYTEQM